jgi:hypothetical protein
LPARSIVTGSRHAHPDLFLQEGSTPPVVIAADEANGHAAVHQGGERPQHASMASGNDRLVLEPEVEQIAVDDHLGSRLAGVREPAQEGALLFAGDCAQVGVADDEDGLRGHELVRS